VFELAELNGARVDPALRLIPVPPRQWRDNRRRRTILRPDELELLVESTPVYRREVVDVAGTTGARLREWTTLTDDRLDLDAGTMFVPAELTKEGRDKTIPLLPAEVRKLRRQLVARAPGTRHRPRPAAAPTAGPGASAATAASTRPAPLKRGRVEPKPRAAGSIRRVAGDAV
jgi:hypothetical protein